MNCEFCGKEIQYLTLPRTKEPIKITCDCQDEKKKAETLDNIERGKKIIINKMKLQAGIPQRFCNVTLDSLTPLTGQREAFKEAKNFIDNQQGLIFSGGVGSGKTLISYAIANTLIERSEISEKMALKSGQGGSYFCRYSNLRFITTIELMNKIKAAFNGFENPQDVMDEFKMAKVLILDDIGAEKSTEFVGEKLFEIIDYRYKADLPLIITTNAIPSELKERIGDRSYDRLREMCLFVSVTEKSQRKTLKGE